MAPFKQTGPFSREFARGVEAMPGRLFGALGRIGNYLGSEKAAQDYTNLLRGQVGRPAAASEMMGPPAPSYYGPGGAPTPIVRGTRDGVTPDRTQSDLYRQYAPQPTFAANPLSQQYRAESEAGRKNMPEVVAGLTQGLEGEKAKAMQTWAQANPMLAYREYNKRFPAGEPTIGPTPATLQADEAVKSATYSHTTPEPGGFTPGVANAVPAPWNTQGAMVDLNRGVQNIQPFQMAKTSGEGMPAFKTTAAYSGPVSERVQMFLKERTPEWKKGTPPLF